MGAKKNFVLDTNVLLHDYRCLYNFQENDIFIPIIVLEELDKFKKGNEQINFNARETVRQLDELSVSDPFEKGVSLGPDLGKLHMVTGKSYDSRVSKAFPERKNDHQILSDTLHVAADHPHMKTILVTKDINLRMKARALGIETEDYNSDAVEDIEVFQQEHPEINEVDSELIDQIYRSREGIDATLLNMSFHPNQCFVLNNGRSSVLARYFAEENRVRRIAKERSFGIEPRNAEQAFALEILNDPGIKLAAVTGKAGTGKTLLALAAALRQNKDYKQIILARPIVALSNKDLGFLPGDEKQKIAPYMQPLFDNLNVIKHQFNLNGSEYRLIQEMQENGQLVIEALAYIRGRSLSESYCIIDEAQNLTPHEIKTVITRAGEGTKMVFTGDIEQIDSPYLDSHSNGLVYMIDKMRGQQLFGHVNLVKGERSELSELASRLL